MLNEGAKTERVCLNARSFPVSSELTINAAEEDALVDTASPMRESVKARPGLGRYAHSWRRLARIFQRGAAASTVAGPGADGSGMAMLLDSLNDWICGVDA